MLCSSFPFPEYIFFLFSCGYFMIHLRAAVFLHPGSQAAGASMLIERHRPARRLKMTSQEGTAVSTVASGIPYLCYSKHCETLYSFPTINRDELRSRVVLVAECGGRRQSRNTCTLKSRKKCYNMPSTVYSCLHPTHSARGKAYPFQHTC